MQDRRLENRTTAVFRPALIETEGFCGFCLVRNLSSNGMMARVFAQLIEGSRIGVQLSPDITFYGSVIWCSESNMGVHFDGAIDVHGVLASLACARPDGKANRAPRLQIQADGHVMLEDRAVAISLQDISQKGAKVRASFLRPGDEVILCLDGLEPKRAVVRWARLGIAGLNFFRPLGFDQLGEWVITKRLKPLTEVPASHRVEPQNRLFP